MLQNEHVQENCDCFEWQTVASVTSMLLSCVKSHMLSASRRQPQLLHVSAVGCRQIW